MNFLKYIAQDIKANQNNSKGFFLVVFFRIVQYFQQKRSIVLRLVGLPIKIFYNLIIKWIMGVELKPSTSIGSGFVIYHGQGLVIHEDTIIGENVTLRNNTTIGNKGLSSGKEDKCPVIGNNVDVGANAVIIGDIKIGDNAVIGAGSVVVKNVETNTIVAGNPAKQIRTIR